MIEVAKKLSATFPFVLIDLYEVLERVIFSETAFFPAGCVNIQQTVVGSKTSGKGRTSRS